MSLAAVGAMLVSVTSWFSGQSIRGASTHRAAVPSLRGASGDAEHWRQERRRARLLGKETEDAVSLSSGYDGIFAGLRAEEDAAIAAAEAEGMSAFLGEIDELGATAYNSLPATSQGKRPSGRERAPRQSTSSRRQRPGEFASPPAPPSWALPLYDTGSGIPRSSNGYAGSESGAGSSGASYASSYDIQGAGRAGVGSSSGRVRSGGAADGIERGMVQQLVTLIPTKVMVFIDGTWLYYQLFGNGKHCKLTQRYGDGWGDRYHIDYSRLPQLISDHVSAELMRTQPYAQRAVEVVRVLVFSSFRADEAELISPRQRMFRAMQELHYEVHLGDFAGGQEKCVDIALAVDMLHYATVPNAFDVAVLVSGDRDFIPALVRTRQKGKRVCVCSMRDSASKEYEDPAANVKDFGVLWLDDHLDELVTPIHPSLLNERPAMARFLCTVVDDFLQTCAAGTSSMAQLQAHLGEVALGAVSAADYVKHEFGGLANFLELFEAEFAVGVPPGGEVLPSEASLVVQSKAVAARSEDERIESNLGTAAAAAAATAWAVDDDEFDDDIVDDEEAAASEASAHAAVDARDESTARQEWTPSTARQEWGRSDGALLVDGSLLQMLEDELDRYEEEQLAAKEMQRASARRSSVESSAPDGGSRGSAADGIADSNDESPSAFGGGGRGGARLSGSVMLRTMGTLSVGEVTQLTVPQLKAELRARQLAVVGAKSTLLRRLLEALQRDKGDPGSGAS